MIDFACKRIDLKDLIKCSLGLSKSDYNLLLFLLKENQKFSVKSLSQKLGIDRTTVQKSVKKLLDREILEQFQENLSPGGYRFIYNVKSKDVIKKRILIIIQKWVEGVNKEIHNW